MPVPVVGTEREEERQWVGREEEERKKIICVCVNCFEILCMCSCFWGCFWLVYYCSISTAFLSNGFITLFHAYLMIATLEIYFNKNDSSMQFI